MSIVLRSGSFCSRATRWLQARVWRWRSRPQPQLRLCESLALGEHRFVSVIEFDTAKFLVGGTGNSLAILAVLSTPSAPTRAWEKEEKEGSQDEVPTWKFVGRDLEPQKQGQALRNQA